MKLFIFFSIVFILILFTRGQEHKHEELQALINENIKHNPEIASGIACAAVMNDRIQQASQQNISKISVEFAEVRSDEAVIRQGIIKRGLSKPDSIYNIVILRQTQCDFNLLVKL